MEKIAELKAILADEKKLLGVIKEEIMIISDKYGDERRTSIGFDEYDISMEDLIPLENTVVTMTNLGYIKRMSVNNFKSQNRGGRGIKGMDTIDDDYIEDLFMTTTHHYLMFLPIPEKYIVSKHMRYRKQAEHREEQQLSTSFSSSRVKKYQR